jgi:hypothetical protein
VTMVDEEQHLRMSVVRAMRPAMVEDDGLAVIRILCVAHVFASDRRGSALVRWCSAFTLWADSHFPATALGFEDGMEVQHARLHWWSRGFAQSGFDSR